MKSNWEEVRIGDLCNITSSKRIFAKEYCSKGVAFYRGKEIIQKSKGESISTELYISEEHYNEIKKKFGVPINGDILMTAVGTLGVPYLVEDEEFYFKDGNLVWFRNFRNVLSIYLYYWLKEPYAQSQIHINSIGSTQKAITIDSLKKFNILLPSLEEQKKIASILSALDDKIELNNRINKNLDEQAQALYIEMFEKCENLVHHICRAEEYFNISIGKTPPRKEPKWFSQNPSDVNWVSISDMGDCGLYISSSSEKLTKEAVIKHNIKIVPDNTVLLSFKLTVGRIAITYGEMTTNEAIAHFVTDKKEINEYLYYYLKRFNYQTMGSTSSIATAVNSKIIKAMPFVVPNNEELIKFHRIAAPIFKKIKSNQIENQKLAQLRDMLLPKLMNGEIDVDKVEV